MSINELTIANLFAFVCFFLRYICMFKKLERKKCICVRVRVSMEILYLKKYSFQWFCNTKYELNNAMKKDEKSLNVNKF